jgi:hypothetical protein
MIAVERSPYEYILGAIQTAISRILSSIYFQRRSGVLRLYAFCCARALIAIFHVLVRVDQ